MGNTGEKSYTIINILFRIFVVGVFVYFLFGEILLPKEKTGMEGQKEVYTGEWARVYEDGTAEAIKIPGKYDIERGEEVHLETVLPSDISPGMSMCFRSNRQEIRIYIDGELRQEYVPTESRLFGKTGPSNFVFVELSPNDSGKILKLINRSDSVYSGLLAEVYYGSQTEIWQMFIRDRSTGFFLSVALILLSLFAIMVNGVLWLIYRRKMAMGYMGWVVLLAAVWILGNSEIRQFVFPNVSVLNEITFFMIMLLPFPFIFFMDFVQKKRHHRIYMTMEIFAVVDFVVCTFLQVADIRDFTDTIIFMAITCFLTIMSILYTMILEIISGEIREYLMAAIGIGFMFAAAVVQLIIYFRHTDNFSATVTVMATGLLVLLWLTASGTIRDVFRLEKEKQQAIASGQSKVQFLTNMSHEIRTPINAVLGMDEMILRESSDANITEYAKDIESAGRSLLSLINDILDFSKMESGKMELLLVEYDVATVLNDCYHMIDRRAREKNLEFHIKNDPALPVRLYGDEVRIRQIITNLLTNAVKYTEQGSVELCVNGKGTPDSFTLCIAVKDTGIGIDDEAMDKLFEAFQRVEEIRNRNIEGTGLGLAITKQLVDLMDGEIRVESEYGKGSAFYVEIPQTVISDKEIGSIAEYYHSTLEKMTDYKESFVAPEARILVVDDVPMNLKVIHGFLKETKVQIEDAESGKKCLEMVQKKKYHVILLDHMMPEMDGVETFHRMQKLGHYPSEDAKVIMLTANAIMGVRDEYLAEGFCDYLSKPVRANELEEMIARHLPPEMVLRKSEETIWTEPEKASEKTTEQMESKPFMEQLDFLDAQLGLEYSAGDEDFYREMLGDFVSGSLIEKLQELYENGDWENYRIQIHALKSTSLSIGASGLSEMAKKLEEATKAEDAAYVQEHHGETVESYRVLLEKLKKIL